MKERKKFWKLLIAILLSQGDLLPINGANTKEVDLRRREIDERERERILLLLLSEYSMKALVGKGVEETLGAWLESNTSRVF